MTFDEFLIEINDLFTGYYIDYELEEHTDINEYLYSFTIDCDGLLAISEDKVALAFEDGGACFGEILSTDDKNKCLFMISNIFKNKIKACNYKGMH